MAHLAYPLHSNMKNLATFIGIERSERYMLFEYLEDTSSKNHWNSILTIFVLGDLQSTWKSQNHINHRAYICL